MIITTNTECTIFLNDYKDYKFNVIEFGVSKNSGRTWARNPTNVDTSMNLIVTNVIVEEKEPGVKSFYLECNGNVKCIVIFDEKKDSNTIQVEDGNIKVWYNAKENTERYKSRIRRDEE